MKEEFFLSKNAKKRAGKINISIELDNALILLRFLDQNKYRINEYDDMGERLRNILMEVSSNLHSDIFLKTKSFLYNNHSDFIKRDFDDQYMIDKMQKEIDILQIEFEAEKSKQEALNALEIVNSFLISMETDGFFGTHPYSDDDLKNQKLMIEKQRELTDFLKSKKL